MASDKNGEVVYRILVTVREDGRPVGCGALAYKLQECGLTVSAPTIGRRLQELEQRGLLRKVKVDGRELTDSGREFLLRLEHQREVSRSSEKFLRLLRDDNRKEIMDVLDTRRLVEGHAAALAARNASDEFVNELESLVDKQKMSIRSGEIGVEQDLGFHEAIAKASKNSVLAAVLRLLRSQMEINRAVSTIRVRRSAGFAKGHERIVDAIRRREPEEARKAMEDHISDVIADVDWYWKEIFAQRAPAAERTTPTSTRA